MFNFVLDKAKTTFVFCFCSWIVFPEGQLKSRPNIDAKIYRFTYGCVLEM